jgi:hypothetical protein
VRGISTADGTLSTERKEFADMAISAAASSLTFILEEEDLRRALVGTPLYVHTMIAFACVFLMKVATKWNAVGLNIEPAFAWDLVGRMIRLLESTVTSERHLAHHIASGLSKMLSRSKDSAGPEAPPASDSMWTGPSTYAGQVGPESAIPDGTTWNPYGPGIPGVPDGGVDLNEMMVMNNNIIYEAFGYDPVNDVYDLLTSQFSY